MTDEPYRDLIAELERGGVSVNTWYRMIKRVSHWQAEHEPLVTRLGRYLDEHWDDGVREAPRKWWNAVQRGEHVVGWPLVRNLCTRMRGPKDRHEPCVRPDTLAPIRILDTDDRHVAPDMLAGASNLRTLIYWFDRVPEGEPEPTEGIGELASLERLQLILLRQPVILEPIARLPRLSDLTLQISGRVSDSVRGTRTMTGPVDLTPLAGLRSLRSLSLDLDGTLVARTTDDPLAPLADLPLERLRLTSQEPLPSLTVLARLEHLRELSVERPPPDLSPIAGLTALTSLELYQLQKWPRLFHTPASVRHIAVSECRGLGSLAPFSTASGLEHLRLHGCNDLIDIDVRPFPALRELSITGASAHEVRDLHLAGALEHVSLVGFPELERIAGTPLEPDPAHSPRTLQTLKLAACPRLHEFAGLSGFAAVYQLILDGLDRITELSFVQHIGEIHTVRLYRCPALERIAPLARVAGLRELIIRDCPRIRDADAVAAVPGVSLDR